MHARRRLVAAAAVLAVTAGVGALVGVKAAHRLNKGSASQEPRTGERRASVPLPAIPGTSPLVPPPELLGHDGANGANGASGPLGPGGRLGPGGGMR
jgi:hypothetical protein